MNNIFCGIIFVLVVNTFSSDYTIDAFCTSERSIPPASNEIVAAPSGGGKDLQQATVDEKLKPGGLLYRLRFGVNDHCIYKGKFAEKAIEQNLFVFPFPGGKSLPQMVKIKYYPYDKNVNPADDLPKIYFDNSNLYVELLQTIYWEDNGMLRPIQGMNVRDPKAKKLLRGDLRIAFAPVNAQLFIDNEKLEPQKPGVIFIRDRFPGEYAVTARLDGFRTIETSVIVKPGEITRDSIALPQVIGTLILKDVDPGFGYTLDGEKVAAGRIQVMPGKPHKIVFEGMGIYRSLDTIITIEEGGEVYLGERCVRLYGGIKIVPYPVDAEVFVDDQKKGEGPTVVDTITTGQHKISARREGYTLTGEDVSVKEGEVLEVSINLPLVPDGDGDGVEDSVDECPDVRGFAEYNGCPSAWSEHDSISTNPTGATVKRKEKLLGTTPLFIDLRPGTHQLLISKNDYSDTLVQINVFEGSSLLNQSPKNIVINLHHNKAYLDSLEKAKKKSRLIRQITFGSLGAGFAAGGIYFNGRYDNAYEDYLSARDATSANEKWKIVKKYRAYRNLFYAGAGTLLGLCTISIFF